MWIIITSVVSAILASMLVSKIMAYYHLKMIDSYVNETFQKIQSIVLGAFKDRHR